MQENAEIQGKMLVGNKPYNAEGVAGAPPVEVSPDKKEGEGGVERTRAMPEVVTVSDNYLTDLTACRHALGSANFFKVFRTFYYLANIPKNTHNNPMALFIDKNSLMTHFTQVFGLANSEIAVRFYNMLVDTSVQSRTRSLCQDATEINGNHRHD